MVWSTDYFQNGTQTVCTYVRGAQQHFGLQNNFRMSHRLSRLNMGGTKQLMWPTDHFQSVIQGVYTAGGKCLTDDLAYR